MKMWMKSLIGKMMMISDEFIEHIKLYVSSIINKLECTGGKKATPTTPPYQDHRNLRTNPFKGKLKPTLVNSRKKKGNYLEFKRIIGKPSETTKIN